jgi:competence ComEA-like helix-hairpin-helix protein
MRLFEFLHKYFGFNKRERNGIILLLALIIILIFVRIFLPSHSRQPEVTITRLEALQQQAAEKDADRTKTNKGKNTNTNKFQASSTLFPFDPNTVSVEEAKQLGFTEKLAGTLEKFRSKGGKFKNKEDLRKLYGMKEKLFNSLEPYILIAASDTKQAAWSKEPFTKKGKTIIDLNMADSSQIVSLPMIGPGFTNRILKFRNKLGGYYHIEQLKEVYGMHDSIYDKIKDRIRVSLENIQKINVNTATIEQLKKHPYVTYPIASSIVNYRLKHGLYKEANDLKETGTINDASLEKIKPYLSFE